MSKIKREHQEARRAAAIANARVNQVRNWLLIGFVICILILLAYTAKRPAQPLASAEVIALGASLYQETCASCHGDQGQGHALLEQAPALDSSEHAWHHPDGQIQQLILNGGSLMPGFSETLGEGDVEALIRFIQTFWTAEQLASQQKASEEYPLR